MRLLRLTVRTAASPSSTVVEVMLKVGSSSVMETSQVSASASISRTMTPAPAGPGVPTVKPSIFTRKLSVFSEMPSTTMGTVTVRAPDSPGPHTRLPLTAVKSTPGKAVTDSVW